MTVSTTSAKSAGVQRRSGRAVLHHGGDAGGRRLRPPAPVHRSPSRPSLRPCAKASMARPRARAASGKGRAVGKGRASDSYCAWLAARRGGWLRNQAANLVGRGRLADSPGRALAAVRSSAPPPCAQSRGLGSAQAVPLQRAAGGRTMRRFARTQPHQRMLQDRQRGRRIEIAGRRRGRPGSSARRSDSWPAGARRSCRPPRPSAPAGRRRGGPWPGPG